MKLEGHQAAVNSMKFAPNGVVLATGGFDKLVYIWEVFGECPHVLTLKGHKNSVQEVQFSTDSETIYSASADSTVMVWDSETGQRIKKVSAMQGDGDTRRALAQEYSRLCHQVVGHDSFVNSVCPARRGPPLFVSGSDDGTTKLWDLRACKKPQVRAQLPAQLPAQFRPPEHAADVLHRAFHSRARLARHV